MNARHETTKEKSMQTRDNGHSESLKERVEHARDVVDTIREQPYEISGQA